MALPHVEAATFMERLLRLLYPYKCGGCGQILDEHAGFGLCEKCYHLLPRFHSEWFSHPGLPYVNHLFAAFIYENEIKEAIHKCKFSFLPQYTETLGLLMAEELRKLTALPDVDFIIPVPMHWRKQQLRGFNQAELVARVLSEQVGIPLDNRVLVKTRHTPPQSLSGRKVRLRNLEGVFHVPESQKIEGRSVLLVDDVLTTGSTLNACAKTLYESGAAYISAVVIAIAGK